MTWLIACEYSGRVRDAFLRNGVDAISCDILPSDADGPHIQGDVLDQLNRGWTGIVAHPPCTYLTYSAEWAFKEPDYDRYPGVGYHQKVKPGTLVGAMRTSARRKAVDFVKAIWNAPSSHICIENPRGELTKHLGTYQVIQPYEYGDDASKATCLWLKGLPELQPTQYVEPRIVEGKARWGNQTDTGQNKLPPSTDRWKIRSLTYQGIADAIGSQWSGVANTNMPLKEVA